MYALHYPEALLNLSLLPPTSFHLKINFFTHLHKVILTYLKAHSKSLEHYQTFKDPSF
jgi:hypothetical protein